MIFILKLVEDGPLDSNLKVGDIVSVYRDSQEGSIGSSEKAFNKVAVKFPDPTNAVGGAFPDSYIDNTLIPELMSSEYVPGPSASENQKRRERSFFVPGVRDRFSPDELETLKTAALADGDTAFGGTVSSGVVSGLFTFNDAVRK